MALLGNIAWFVLGGWLVGGIYLLGALVLFPLLPVTLPIVGYAFWPHGRQAVPLRAVREFKRLKADAEGLDADIEVKASERVRSILSLVWALTFGWVLAIAHVLAAVLNLLACVTLLLIPVCAPNALAHLKLIRVALSPFSMRIVPKAPAGQIDAAAAASKL